MSMQQICRNFYGNAPDSWRDNVLIALDDLEGSMDAIEWQLRSLEDMDGVQSNASLTSMVRATAALALFAHAPREAIRDYCQASETKENRPAAPLPDMTKQFGTMLAMIEEARKSLRLIQCDPVQMEYPAEFATTANLAAHALDALEDIKPLCLSVHDLLTFIAGRRQ